MLFDDDDEPNLIMIKTVLIGDSGVGKTSIIKQFSTGEFDPECISSISGQYNSKKMKVYDKEIKLDLWDTAGQDRYRSLAKIFYQDAKIIVFVYDITSIKSFEGLQKYWYKQVQANSDKNAILAVVGNKSDLYLNEQIKTEDGKNFADSIGAIFQTTSAKSNVGIDLLFNHVVKKYLDPSFDYKKDEEKEKELYNAKKNNKKKEKKEKTEKKDNSFNENDTSFSSVKLYNDFVKKNNNRYCC